MQRSEKDLGSIRHIEISLNAICERHKWTLDCLGCPFLVKDFGGCMKKQIQLLLAIARGDKLHIGTIRDDNDGLAKLGEEENNNE